MNADELRLLRQQLPAFVVALIDENATLKARVLALETALKTLREDCPVQACEGDWDPLFALLGEPPVR